MMMEAATLILIAGMVDDFRSRKVHNILVIALLALTAAASLYVRGLGGSMLGLSAMALALALTIPLFALRVFGGGDVKLFAVFALAVEPSAMFYTLIYSFLWGSVFGLTRAALQGHLPVLVRNTVKTASRQQKLQPQELSRIPYTFALFLGWFTYLTMLKTGAL